MGGPARIVLEAGKRQFLGDAIAADHRPALQHQAAESGLREIGGRDQAVVSGTGDDDVETIRHTKRPHYSRAKAALRAAVLSSKTRTGRAAGSRPPGKGSSALRCAC
jgi:hypothetical protein